MWVTSNTHTAMHMDYYQRLHDVIYTQVISAHETNHTDCQFRMLGGSQTFIITSYLHKDFSAHREGAAVREPCHNVVEHRPHVLRQQHTPTLFHLSPLPDLLQAAAYDVRILILKDAMKRFQPVRQGLVITVEKGEIFTTG